MISTSNNVVSNPLIILKQMLHLYMKKKIREQNKMIIMKVATIMRIYQILNISMIPLTLTIKTRYIICILFLVRSSY